MQLQKIAISYFPLSILNYRIYTRRYVSKKNHSYENNVDLPVHIRLAHLKVSGENDESLDRPYVTTEGDQDVQLLLWRDSDKQKYW